MRSLVLGAMALLGVSHVAAATLQYSLSLPAEETIQYRIDVQVEHPGRLTVEADWSGPRVLSFRLERSDTAAQIARRSGPPPLRLDIDVAEADLTPGVSWSLWIRGLPARESASGRLELRLPEPALPVEARPVVASPAPAAPAPQPEPWRVPSAAPDGASEPWREFHLALERFRVEVVEGHPQESDDYQWQDEMLRFLVQRRERGDADGARLSPETCSWLRRVASTTEAIAELNRSHDAILAGPPPAEPDRRRVWSALHRQQVLPMERDLDTLLSDFARGHVPELAGQAWVPRFLSCLTVCQRHFEEATQVGRDRAAHGDLARRQWVALETGARACGRLANVDQPEPVD